MSPMVSVSEINYDDGHYKTLAYIRIVSLAIAFYDYFETWPTAAKFYRDAWRERRASLGLSSILFFLIRLTSILVLVISNIGFFRRFTAEECVHYYLLPPAFKVIQGMVSHVILGMRAYTVSQRSRYVGTFLAGLYVIIVTFEWIATMGNRTAAVDNEYLCCKAISTQDDYIFSAWIYYVLAIAFDFVATTITVYYLVKQFKSSSGLISRVVRIMLRDGIGYLVILTLTNAINVVFYKSKPDIQNACANLGYSVTWIMSQRLITHLYRVSVKKRSEQVMTNTSNGLLTVTQALTTNRSINNALRSQFSRKTEQAFTDLTVPEFSMDQDVQTNSPTSPRDDEENVVEVRVERTVKITSPRKVRYELEDYSRGAASRRDGSRRY